MNNKAMDCSLLCFVVIMGVGILLVLSSIVITVLQDYTMIVVALMFLASGITAVLVSGMHGVDLARIFWNGLVSAQVFGISAQLCIVAYAFGDGFSNVLYPTNPVLLISLGLADVNYAKWVKWSGKFQLMNLLLTSLILLFGLAVGY